MIQSMGATLWWIVSAETNPLDFCLMDQLISTFE